jgi:hypothetical protein
MVVVMMVMRMYVMMVVMRRIIGLGTFATALQIWCVSAVAFEVLCIVPGSPSITPSSSRSCFRAASSLVYLRNGSTNQVAALGVSQRRAHTGWCSIAIGWQV